jgi:hypothetical protein
MKQFDLAENAPFHEIVENCPEMTVWRHVEFMRQAVNVERMLRPISHENRAHDDLTSFIALFGNER